MNDLAPIRLAALACDGVSHAFFTRSGGVSAGVYATLNGGVGSNDAPEAVAENRARMAAWLGVAADRLLIPFQIHSPDVVAISEPWAAEARPRVDAIVTATASCRRRRVWRSASPAPIAAWRCFPIPRRA